MKRRNAASWSTTRDTRSGWLVAQVSSVASSGEWMTPSLSGIGSPCGSTDGMAEHRVDALDQPIGHGVLELFGLVVDFVPAHAHDLDEEQLDEPVPAQHGGGELLAGRRQPDAGVRLVEGEAGFGQRLDHRRRRARHDAERRRQLAHRHQVAIGRGAVAGQPALAGMDRLQVVFDRARRQHGRAIEYHRA